MLYEGMTVVDSMGNVIQQGQNGVVIVPDVRLDEEIEIGNLAIPTPAELDLLETPALVITDNSDRKSFNLVVKPMNGLRLIPGPHDQIEFLSDFQV